MSILSFVSVLHPPPARCLRACKSAYFPEFFAFLLPCSAVFLLYLFFFFSFFLPSFLPSFLPLSTSNSIPTSICFIPSYPRASPLGDARYISFPTKKDDFSVAAVYLRFFLRRGSCALRVRETPGTGSDSAARVAQSLT